MLESFYGDKFSYKKLTEEEQQKRGILGRLVGVIADSKQPTRNGRLYSRSLWEKVFDDPIILEKIDHKSFFGELGHPLDRDTVDETKIAICLAEKPKIGADGKIYGVFDILNTPNGKILKTLCDYGTDIGISSRGNGDIINEDEVNPDTYSCECFDAVILPAVKAARPKYVTESLDTNNIKLKLALTEAYNTANTKDKEIMKNTFDSLKINLNEDIVKIIPKSEQEVKEVPEGLLEETDTDVQPTEEPKETSVVENEVKVPTIKEFIDQFKDYDPNTKLYWAPFIINGAKYDFDGLTIDEKGLKTDNSLTIKLDYTLPKEDYNIDETDTENVEVSADDTSSMENLPSDKETKTTEEAIDNGVDEALENLKEAIRQNNLLSEKIKVLENQETVRDAEVKELKESIEKYRSGFQRLSELASKAQDLEIENSKLEENLKTQKNTVQSLTEQLQKNQALIKSNEANEAKAKINYLNEKLKTVLDEAENTENSLNLKLTEANNKLQERTKIAKAYQQKYVQVLERYIASKAKMLGVRAVDITKKLNENYTLDDIDQVCADLIDHPQFSLKGYGKPSIRITENKETLKKVALNPDEGYEIDDDLLTLAGLK